MVKLWSWSQRFLGVYNNYVSKWYMAKLWCSTLVNRVTCNLIFVWMCHHNLKGGRRRLLAGCCFFALKFVLTLRTVFVQSETPVPHMDKCLCFHHVFPVTSTVEEGWMKSPGPSTPPSCCCCWIDTLRWAYAEAMHRNLSSESWTN